MALTIIRGSTAGDADVGEWPLQVTVTFEDNGKEPHNADDIVAFKAAVRLAYEGEAFISLMTNKELDIYYEQQKDEVKEYE